VLLDVATSPGFSEETVRIYLATGLTLVGRPDGHDDEEAELRVVLVPLPVAVQAALAGQIVNVMAVAALLAADAVLRGTVPQAQRPAWGSDAPWTVHRGPGSPSAPPLAGSKEL
jgi:ADP-ribose pyrophosphatase